MAPEDAQKQLAAKEREVLSLCVCWKRTRPHPMMTLFEDQRADSGLEVKQRPQQLGLKAAH